MARGAINVQITGDYNDKDIKRAIKDLQGLQSQSAPAGKSMAGVTSAFKGMALAAGAFISFNAVKDFMADAIQQGSALEESLSKVGAVFGQSADDIVAWSEQSATAFGQSQAQALEAVGTFGNLLQAFGVTRDEAARMSKSITELAADLASFNNTTVDDALIALRSGLSGETEPLKRYGIAINDARLKTVAFEKGLYSGTGQLNVTAKSLAAFELIMRDSTLAQGDFARTSDGFANQMRIIGAQFDNLKAALGVSFIDGLNLADGGLSNIGSRMGDLEPLAKAAGQALGEVASGLLDVASGAADAFAEINKPLEEQAWWAATLSTLWKIGSADLSKLVFEFNGYNDSVEENNRAIAIAVRQDAVMAERLRTTRQSLVNHTDAMTEAAGATGEVVDAHDALKDALKEVDAAISAVTSRNDFLDYLDSLAKKLKDTNGQIAGTGPKARESQDILIEGFQKAQKAAQDWGERTGASAAQIQMRIDKLAGETIDNFVKQGFKREDIEKWLGNQGIWTGPLIDRVQRAEHRARIDAYNAGVNIGGDLTRGMAQGIATSNVVNIEAARAVRNAERAARAAAESQSPSQLFARIGGDLMLGLVVGMAEKRNDVDAFAKTIPESLAKAFQSRLEVFRNVVQQQLQIIDDAKAAIKSYADAIVDSVVGSLDFATTDAEGNPLTPEQMVNLMLGDVAQQQQMVMALANSGVMTQLPAALAQKILTLPPDAAIALANYLAARPEQLEQLNTNYNALANYTLTALGIPMGEAFATIGDESASVAIDKAKAKIKERSDEFKQWVKSKLQTEIVIKVRYQVVGGVPSGTGAGGDLVVGARGGIVNRPTFALIGEAGPEAVVPLDRTRGNDPLPMTGRAAAASTTINLTVNAGMGTDGASVGRQVVEAIRQYERQSGKVFVAA